MTDPSGYLVLIYPVKKSYIANSTVPSALLATTFTPIAVHIGFKSEIGDAVAISPPIEATLQISLPAK
jgi:hypothetical protein